MMIELKREKKVCGVGPQLQIFRFKMYEKFHKNKKFETDYDKSLTNLF